MRSLSFFAERFFGFLTVTFVAVLLIAMPTLMEAQSAGNNAVYSSPTSIVGSSAFIDASVLAGSDICAKINAALSLITSTPGAVIDARGASTAAACPSGDTPWSYGGTVYSTPSVILLPAGTIVIHNTWILPDKTRIIGEGSGASGASITTIQASTASFSDPDTGTLTGPTTMIRMGSTTYSGYSCSTECFGVGIEDLVLDGQGQAISGITNVASQELSYVNRVNLYRIMATGLQIGYSTSAKAQNSGPYSNIRFETGTGTTSASTTCARIIGSPTTRGIHGLSCIASGSTEPNVAIYLDSTSNSIEDVYVSGLARECGWASTLRRKATSFLT